MVKHIGLRTVGAGAP